MTGGLEHPGIVPVYGLGTYGDGRPYYAMRFIKGASLKEAIERFHTDASLKNDPGRRSLELRKLLRSFLDVCNAIDYAHSRGVLHRDIKPGNVIVGRYGETLVVDWGLAKATGKSDPAADEATLVPSSSGGSGETQPGSALGTPAFMSPEQAEGNHQALGPRSDVYSLGATLYCLLTGGAPFVGDDAGELLRQVQRGDFLRPRELDPSIDSALEAVCKKAMALKPADRYNTCRELADDVERWLADEPVTAWREPTARRARRWMRRHRVAVTSASLTLITATTLISMLFVAVAKEQGRTLAALQQAELNLEQAREAVDDYFVSISEETLLDEPGMQPLRKKLLELALGYHQRFLRLGTRDSRRLADVAQSQYRLGAIGDDLDQIGDALAAFERARALFEDLSKRNRSLLEYRIRGTECWAHRVATGPAGEHIGRLGVALGGDSTVPDSDG